MSKNVSYYHTSHSVFFYLVCACSRWARCSSTSSGESALPDDVEESTDYWNAALSPVAVLHAPLSLPRDNLLLETGFLCVLVAPLCLVRGGPRGERQHDRVTFWLLRWLLFRLMFASGVVKLTSRCPTWWGLTGVCVCVCVCVCVFRDLSSCIHSALTLPSKGVGAFPQSPHSDRHKGTLATEHCFVSRTTMRYNLFINTHDQTSSHRRHIPRENCLRCSVLSIQR